eukprot:CAMPEP_0201963092 /NCGR_PEP_ID=MMETSP0904-20121228/9059_1 /ASSEMBLY_ACC=CAM_ASM_000553 /TAXON_ID=420261 /ORGANISM="Thalassiosira antarctica, Strain CCMP982" /LENGTH=37 /DNA_ID= /DNA_START= /DNA_END= /DNA_ORIENTATION=
MGFEWGHHPSDFRPSEAPNGSSSSNTMAAKMCSTWDK